MSEIILHHYPESPFSEKIRLLLRFKGVNYKSVIIPMIMPRPDLMPLTGGYRKTPVMQMGADIYCDSAIIARTIDGLHPDRSIYPPQVEAVAGALAHWTDTFFFKVAVAVAFQPRALASNSILADPKKAAAFAADRAELSKGSTELRMPFQTANPYFVQHLARLETQLATNDAYLFGDVPTIADFATYHCLWFIYNNEVLREPFVRYENVGKWMDRMAAVPGATQHEISGAEALKIAKAASPNVDNTIHGVDGLKAGDEVEVMPIDYGFQPVKGKLVTASLEEIAVLRTDEQVGEVAVHFPRLGFQVRAAAS